ncbi:CD209 antigen-like protein D [Silurus meridionalis]|nr:CD209 antigen-like protein D [Silurus meridionalis]
MDRRSDIYENTEDNHPGECVYANWEKQRDSCILNDQESKQSDNSIQQCLRYFITSQKKSWSDSRQDCKAKGADLVIISSKEEQEYLSRRFRGVEAWIGLTDTEEEGKWMWVDRTPLSTKYWWDGEPNDYKQEEDCAVTGSKFAKAEVLTWADYPCTFPVFGLCKKN